MTNSKSTSRLCKVFHVCNEGTPQHADWVNITSEKQLAPMRVADAQVVWLINIHLNWHGQSSTNDHGFDIARDLRLVKGYKDIIIFYSPAPASFFVEKSKSSKKHLLIFGRGSAFLEAPFNSHQLDKLIARTHPLTEASLHDVVTMLCNLKGIVFDRLMHDLKFGNDVRPIEKAIEYIAPYLSDYQKKEIELDHYSKKLVETIKVQDENGFFINKQKLLQLCALCLFEDGEKPEPGIPKKFKVLFLEDNSEERAMYKTNLGDHFDILFAETAVKAMNLLEKDISNSILAVVTDWRLYTDENRNYWQEYQGYEVLEYAGSKGIRALMAITSEADFVIHQIRNLMKTRFTLFKKENLTSRGEYKLLMDVLQKACENITREIPVLLDELARWTAEPKARGIKSKSLKQQYIEVWNSIERDSYFERVSSIAKELVEYALSRKSDDLPLNKHFNLPIPTQGPVSLFPVLVYRRVWMALWFSKTKPRIKLTQDAMGDYSDKIYKEMFAYSSYKSDVRGSATQNNFKLCISPADVHHCRVLPQENEWLVKNGWMDNPG